MGGVGNSLYIRVCFKQKSSRKWLEAFRQTDLLSTCLPWDLPGSDYERSTSIVIPILASRMLPVRSPHKLNKKDSDPEGEELMALPASDAELHQPA